MDSCKTRKKIGFVRSAMLQSCEDHCYSNWTEVHWHVFLVVFGAQRKWCGHIIPLAMGFAFTIFAFLAELFN